MTAFIFAVAHRLKKNWHRRAWLWCMGCILLVGSALETRERAFSWENTDRLFLTALQAYPDDPSPYFFWAKTVCSHGSLERCEALLDDFCARVTGQDTVVHPRATVNCPEYSNVLDFLIPAYIGAGRLEQGRLYSQKLMEQHPEAPVAWWGMGETALEEGKTEEAMVYLEQAQSLSPKSRSIRESQALLFCLQGKNEEMERAWAVALSLGADTYERPVWESACAEKAGSLPR